MTIDTLDDICLMCGETWALCNCDYFGGWLIIKSNETASFIKDVLKCKLE